MIQPNIDWIAIGIMVVTGRRPAGGCSNLLWSFLMIKVIKQTPPNIFGACGCRKLSLLLHPPLPINTPVLPKKIIENYEYENFKISRLQISDTRFPPKCGSLFLELN